VLQQPGLRRATAGAGCGSRAGATACQTGEFSDIGNVSQDSVSQDSEIDAIAPVAATRAIALALRVLKRSPF